MSGHGGADFDVNFFCHCGGQVDSGEGSYDYEYCGMKGEVACQTAFVCGHFVEPSVFKAETEVVDSGVLGRSYRVLE